MRKLFLALSFILLSTTSYCAPRSLEQIKAAAAKVLKLKIQPNRVNALNGKTNVLNVLKEGNEYTVVGYADGGFAVIANDDMFDAVIGYSDGQFSQTDMPPAMVWWMSAMDESLRKQKESGITSPRAVSPADAGYPASVDELVTSSWGQDTPFNDQCPTYTYAGKTQRYVTGCVATAMSQIMYFHKYPLQGQGRKIYDFTSPVDGKQWNFDVRFSRVKYDWDNMIDSYDHGYNALQAEAVAQLMFHCGVSVNMMYNMDGSGAFTKDAANSLREYFSYSTKMYTRDVFTKNEWMNIIYKEISEHCPILYGGVSPSQGGHAFVLDGYDENGLVHINWGWNGSQDGYFEIGELNGFTDGQDMILMHTATDPEIPYSSQLGIMESLTWSNGSTTRGRFTVQLNGTLLSYTVTNLLNCDSESFAGKLMLMAEPSDGGSAVSLNSFTTSIGPNGGYPSMSKDNISIRSLSDGTYRLFLASQSDLESTWQPVHSNENIVNNYILTITGGNATLTAGEPGWTTGIDNVTVNGNTLKPAADNRIYSIDGRYLGTDVDKLDRGMYIRNGVKFVKK